MRLSSVTLSKDSLYDGAVFQRLMVIYSKIIKNGQPRVSDRFIYDAEN